jgi:glutaredoxin
MFFYRHIAGEEINHDSWLKWLPFGLALAAALVLSLEYVLNEMGHSGLCPTTGCKTVGGFVRYGESIFIVLGVMFFWSLAGLYFFSIRLKNDFLWAVSLVFLAGGLAFDGGILGFQTFAIGESCILCYSVGAALLLILAAFGIYRRSIVSVALGLAVLTAGFISQAFFLFPDKPPNVNETVLTTAGERKPGGTVFYYFFSLQCPYCAEVLRNLEAEKANSAVWYFSPLAVRPEDKRKLSALLDDPAFEDNPFRAILRIEKSPAPDTKISPRVEKATEAAIAFMRNSGYRGVPLLIAQESPVRRVVLGGRDAILDYLAGHKPPGH